MPGLKIYHKWPPVLQPRLTWGYCLSSLAIAYVAYCTLLWKPFFSSALPRNTGPYPVGAIDVEIPVREPRLIHDAVFKKTGEEAFKLETVLFTIYYPTEKSARSSSPNHYWVPKPLHLTSYGYAKFARINNWFTNNLLTAAMGLLVGHTKIPVAVDVPILQVNKLTHQKSFAAEDRTDSVLVEEDASDGLPIIVFTHGMASSRTQYSYYLSELASRGYVCAAIEHRDGSCPGTEIHDSTDPSRKVTQRLTFNLSEVKRNPAAADAGEELTGPEFKQIQLAFREAEILETTHILHQLSTNSEYAEKFLTQNSRGEGHNAALRTWLGRLNTHMTILAGHSYGATGALQALRPDVDGDAPDTNALQTMTSPSGAPAALDKTTTAAARKSTNPARALPKKRASNFSSYSTNLPTIDDVLTEEPKSSSASQNSTTSKRHLFAAGIILDPGKSSGPLNSALSVPLLIIHSNTWSRPSPSKTAPLFYGRSHFDTVRNLALDSLSRGHDAWFMTSLGTSHPSITDAPLIEPTLLKWTTGAKLDVFEAARQYMHVSDDFGFYLRTGEKRGVLGLKANSEEWSEDNSGMVAEWREYWQIHVSPN